MSDATSRTVKIGRRAVTADMVVLACFAVTVLVSAAVWQARDNLPLDAVVDQYVRRRPPPEDLAARATQLAVEARGRSDEELQEMAGDLVATGIPSNVNVLGMHLIRDNPEPGSRRLAVLAAEIGGLRWNDAGLLWRAGSEYGYGRYVDRDYAKAMRYLRVPALAQLPAGQLRLGQVLLAEDNPWRDAARGQDLIRKAAAKGYQPAITYLERLGG